MGLLGYWARGVKLVSGSISFIYILVVIALVMWLATVVIIEVEGRCRVSSMVVAY